MSTQVAEFNRSIENASTRDYTDRSLRQAAIVAGSALIIMAIAAGYAVGFVFDSLIVAEDAAVTANNIRSSEILFRSGIFSWLIILICDVLAAWGLTVFFKPVNKRLSLLTGWLRLIYTAVLGAALLNLVIVLLLTSGGEYLAGFQADQLDGLVMLFLNGFDGVWSLGLVVFGLHLMLLGALALKSGTVPKIVGVLLIFAAFGYLIVHGGNLLMPNFEEHKAAVEMVFMIPMIIGEVGLAFWLLIKGGKVQAQDQPTLETV